MWSTIVAVGKKALKHFITKVAINKATGGKSGSGMGAAGCLIIMLPLALLFAAPLVIFQSFGNLICTFVDCDEDTGKREDVISIDMLEDVAERMEKLREDANKKVDVKGQNYGKYILAIADEINDEDISLEEEEEEEEEKEDAKSEMVENSETQSEYPQADPAVWVTGKTKNVNYGLLMRLAAVGEHYGKKVNIYSGWRGYAHQKRLYDCFHAGDPTCNLAAHPMHDTHVMGLAVDVDGWLTSVPSSALAPFGLAKEIASEDWHIWAKGMYNIPREQRMYFKYDGYGVPQELIDAMMAGVDYEGEITYVQGEGPTFESEKNRVSEAYIHLLALGQMDDLSFGFLKEDRLEKEEEKGTNIGKTWKLAKAIKEAIKEKEYYDDEMQKRAKKEEWEDRQYLKLARWEIQKCFLVGDQDVGFWENFLWSKGPKPCANIKKLTGEDIVPEKLQGVVNKTIETTTTCVNVNAIYNYDTRNISGVTAAQIEQGLSGLLKGYGSTYIEAGNKYGVDPAFLAALTMAETGGDSKALREKNNVGGLMNPGGGQKTFSSIKESIEYLAKIITNGNYYHKAGLYTVEQIHTRYSPEGAANDPNNSNANWVTNVYKFMGMMGVELVPVSGEEQTETTTTCENTTNKKGTTLAYPDVQEMLFSYADISLISDKDDFKDSLKTILDNLYTRQVGSSDLSNSQLAAPKFIVPLEEGTYEVSVKFGSKTDEGISQGTVLKVGAETPIYSSLTGSVESVWEKAPDNKVVIIKNQTYGYIEYSGVSDTLVSKGSSVVQGELIGAVSDAVEIKICMKISEDNAKPVCIDSYEPTKEPAKLTFSSSGLDKELIAKRTEEYKKWKKDGNKVFMPGYTSYSTLGKLSAKYETNGQYDLCVMDPVGSGGLQCGGYQIADAPGTLKTFVDWTASNYPQFYKHLKGVPRTLDKFSIAWKAAYASDPQGFIQCQHDFIAVTHYQEQADKLKASYGIDLNTRSNTLRDVIWSYAVQHRNNTQKAWGNTIGTNWNNMTDKQMIQALYSYRKIHWPKLITRFNNEEKDALEMLAAEGFE